MVNLWDYTRITKYGLGGIGCEFVNNMIIVPFCGFTSFAHSSGFTERQPITLQICCHRYTCRDLGMPMIFQVLVSRGRRLHWCLECLGFEKDEAERWCFTDRLDVQLTTAAIVRSVKRRHCEGVAHQGCRCSGRLAQPETQD